LHLKVQHSITAILARRARQGLSNYIVEGVPRSDFRGSLRSLLIPLKNSVARSYGFLDRVFGSARLHEVVLKVEKVLNDVCGLIGVSSAPRSDFDEYIDYLDSIRRDLIDCSRLLKRVKSSYAKTEPLKDIKKYLRDDVASAVRRACGNKVPGGIKYIAKICLEVLDDVKDDYNTVHSLCKQVINSAEKFIFDIRRVFFDVRNSSLLEKAEFFERHCKTFKNIIEELEKRGVNRGIIDSLESELEKKLCEIGCDDLCRRLIVQRIMRNYRLDRKFRSIAKCYSELSSNLLDLLRSLCNVSSSFCDFACLLCERNIRGKSVVEEYLRRKRFKAFIRMLEEKFSSGEKVTLLDVFESASRVLGGFFFSQLLEEPSHKLVVRRGS